MPRVLIIDDEAGVRMTLEDRLTAEGYAVSSVADGIRGEETAMSGGFDIILLDLMLPGRDGFAVCKNLRDAGINTPVLMLTARDTSLDTVMGLRQGADDYLAKPFDMAVLLARMEALLRRSGGRGGDLTALSPVAFGSFRLDREKGTLFLEQEPVNLHSQEYRLLEYLVTHPDTVLSRDRILDEVWGYESETTTRTVDVHVARLRKHLGEAELPKHLQTVRGRGYRFIL
ncbi:MAG: response regulator transcription factor [Spirochaetales bacterium]|nr:response regulator transcription factor [Spirochaetales bacterium]